MRDQNSIFGSIDWMMVFLYLLLVLMGWANIYAAVYNEEHSSILDMSQVYGRQLIWIVTAIVLALLVMLLDPKIFSTFAFVFYGLSLLLLAFVLVFGREIAGSKSWIQLGSFALQPSEFAKVSTALALAAYLSRQNIRLDYIKTRTIAAGIIILPAGLIFLQNDTGSALVFSSFILVLYREGLSGKILVFGVVTIILFVLTLLFDKFIVLGLLAIVFLLLVRLVRKNRADIYRLTALLIIAIGFVFSVNYGFNNILEKHQQKRINVLIGKVADLKGAGYNVHQSKIAIGSGGFQGKGFLKGTQTKFDFVPEQSTDFIFCTVGEEWGFLGSSIVIILFMVVLIRLVLLAERQRSKFSRIYGYGVVSILLFHFVVNIGMTIGIAPVIGIPLPFFSYGGSSLWAFTILLFIFIKQDSYRLNVL